MNIEPDSSLNDSGEKLVEQQSMAAPTEASAGAVQPPAPQTPEDTPAQQPASEATEAHVNAPADEMLTDVTPAVEEVRKDAGEPGEGEVESRDLAADDADADNVDANVDDVDEEEEEEIYAPAEPLEFIDESKADEDMTFDWYILKVAVNREDSIKEALLRKVRMNALERYFREVVVPTEDVAEFTKTGKRRIVKKKIYPGYILVNMSINDESWFIVRETPGIGDFTGAAGKPAPMDPKDVERILRSSKVIADEDTTVKTAIPFKTGDRVRVKEGYFQNFEGDVDAIDQANGRVTVMINIFGRSTPVELEHWQIEMV